MPSDFPGSPKLLKGALVASKTHDAARVGGIAQSRSRLHSSPAASQQRAVSNQAMQRMLRTGAVQAKLTVNTPGDKYEQEADRVADQVMRMTSAAAGDPPRIQRACTSCNRELESQTLQRMCAGCEEEELQRKEHSGAQDLSTDVESQVQALQGGGKQLPPRVREFFEPRFSRDFSDVRVHTNGAAAQAAHAVNALAYTSGRDIVFGRGQYAPETESGKRLLAHELTHVVQQDAMGSRGLQRLCGPAEIGTAQPSDCALVSETPHGDRFLFNPDCDTFAPGAEDLLREFVETIPEESRIDILGMASADGNADFNVNLSCHRAKKAASFIQAQGLGANIRYIRATGGVPGTEHDSNFRAVDIAITEPTIHGIKVVAKSFIAPIGSRTGTAPCAATIVVPTPLPLPLPMSAQDRLDALAVAIDMSISENPLTDSKDKGYRLYSERTFSVACLDGQVSSVSASGLDTDVGMEGPLQPSPLITSAVILRRDSPTKFSFSWTGKGRPHLAAEPAFQAVCPRSSVFIWHRVEGEIDCNGLRLTGSTPIVGSDFPSHRVFVNGRIRGTVPQDTFSNLWEPDPTDATLVE